MFYSSCNRNGLRIRKVFESVDLYEKAYGAVTGVDFNPANDGPRMLAEGFEKAYVEDLLMRNGQRFFAFVEED